MITTACKSGPARRRPQRRTHHLRHRLRPRARPPIHGTIAKGRASKARIRKEEPCAPVGRVALPCGSGMPVAQRRAGGSSTSARTDRAAASLGAIPAAPTRDWRRKNGGDWPFDRRPGGEMAGRRRSGENRPRMVPARCLLEWRQAFQRCAAPIRNCRPAARPLSSHDPATQRSPQAHDKVLTRLFLCDRRKARFSS
jgi:hypothetical protein